MDLDTFKRFVEEYNSIQRDISLIENMEISEEAKELPLLELREQKKI